MDPNSWRMNAPRLGPKGPTPPTDQAVSNFLMAAAQRDAARRHVLENARRQSLGLAMGARPNSVARTPLQSAEDRIVFEALMVAGRAVQPRPDAAPLQGTPNKALAIPSRDTASPDMTNIQLSNIVDPHPHDILSGRGGSSNNHPGNENFRQLVQTQKVKYISSSKEEKYQLSADIVRAVRAQNPPGRFLQKEILSENWYDIGDEKAREKTAQALREGAKELRQTLNIPKIRDEPSPSLIMSMEQRYPRLASLQPTRGVLDNRSVATMQSGNNAPVMSGLGGRTVGPPISNEHQLQRQNSNTHSETAPLSAEKLAAEIMEAHVEQQARTARVIADARAAARAASIPLGVSSPVLQPRVVPSIDSGMAGRTLPGIPLDRRQSWDAAAQLGATARPGYGQASRGLHHPPSMSPAPPVDIMPRLDSRNVMLANVRSLAAQQQQHVVASDAANRELSTLPDDLVNRLVLAETLAQRTVQGAVTQVMKREEKRTGLYLDAGLLGIDLGELAAKRAGGQSEQSIIDECYERLKLKSDKENDGERNGRSTSEPVYKKARLNGENESNGQVEELAAIGGMLRLCSQQGAEGGSDEPK